MKTLGLVWFGGALAFACSSAPTSVPTPAPEETPNVVDLGPPPFDATASGWAAVPSVELPNGTTGGEGGKVVTVSTLADFLAEAKLASPRIILLSGVIGDGTRVTIASNHSVIGLPGAEFHGGLKVSGGVNVIIRNLKIVGNNCADSTDKCENGADAVSIGDNAHHVWVDHCDISDGSDGNLDVNGGADFVTISWTKFWYSGQRAGGHQFSNLVGSSDNEPGDAGHLRVSYHHDWWGAHVRERMPRVRYGQVHLFNNLYTATGNNYCIGVGVFANVLTEANFFFEVRDPIESSSYSNEQSVVVSHDNLYVNSAGTNQDRGSAVFQPPYPYTLEDAATIQATVENGAGVCPSRFVFGTTPVSCSASSAEPASTP
jgi:pectate lyase